MTVGLRKTHPEEVFANLSSKLPNIRAVRHVGAGRWTIVGKGNELYTVIHVLESNGYYCFAHSNEYQITPTDDMEQYKNGRFGRFKELLYRVNDFSEVFAEIRQL